MKESFDPILGATRVNGWQALHKDKQEPFLAILRQVIQLTPDSFQTGQLMGVAEVANTGTRGVG